MTQQERSGTTSPSRIPEFANYEEEAEFWDTHDFTDYDDGFKPVQVRVAANLSDGITVILDATSLGQFRAQAAERGISPATLARLWILERLGEDGSSYGAEGERAEMVATGPTGER